MPLRFCCLELRNGLSRPSLSSMIVFTATQSLITQVEMVGFLRAGRTERNSFQVLSTNIEHQANASLGVQLPRRTSVPGFQSSAACTVPPKLSCWR